MKKVNKKKGFTLAELLVVIAILAILIAVAVPIFTGVLGDAEEKVINANIRAVRGAAVTEILSSETERVKTGPWKATATISDSGDMKTLEITDWASGDTETDADTHKPVSSGGIDTYVVKITALS